MNEDKKIKENCEQNCASQPMTVQDDAPWYQVSGEISRNKVGNEQW